MGHARSKCRVKGIQIHAAIDRSVEGDSVNAAQVTHLVDLDAVPFRLLALMRVQGANADLDKTFNLAAFHQPRERRRVAIGIVEHVCIKVGMGVDMQNV